MGSCGSKSSGTATVARNETPSNAPKTFRSTYQMGDILGQGAFSTVRQCTAKATKQQFAVKIVERAGLPKDDEASLRSETRILKSIDCPHIVKCYDFYEEEKCFYVVIEYLQGGELFDRIVKKSVYSEKEARDLVHILLTAIKYCHDRMIVHRDLKPENLLLKSKTDDRDLKLADFGFAVETDATDRTLKEQCGTPGYVAPEILKGEAYGRPADMWSVGVITYIILGGYPPFYDDNQKMLFRKIKAGSYEFHVDYWKNVSAEAKDLISCLLTLNPAKRMTVDQALNHSWIRRADAELESRNLNSNLAELRKFNAKRKFRAAVKMILAVNRMKALLGPTSAVSSGANTARPATPVATPAKTPQKYKV